MSRRIEAVLLWDIIDSTAMWAELGQSVLERDVIRPMRSLVQEVTDRHGGSTFAERVQGDGGCARFASAGAAMSAAVDIQRRCRRVSARPLSTARLRIVIAASDMLDDEYGAPVGFALVVCARLEALAKGRDTNDPVILCSDVVRSLAHGWDRTKTRHLGQFHLKGLGEPTDVYEIDWEVSPLAEALGVPVELQHVEADFVGRRAELEELSAAWRRLPRTGAELVVIEGGAGLGKTRLCAQVAATVRADGGAVVFGHCDEVIRSPYEPFVQILRSYLSTPSDAGPDISDLESALSPLLPELADRLPTADSRPASDPPTERHRLFEALTEAVRRLAADTPTLLVLDDLTWATPETLDFLVHLHQHVRDAPLLVLATHRPDRSALAERSARSPLADSVILLEPLPDADVQELAVRLVRRSGGEERDRLTAVVRAARGNPLYVTELLRARPELADDATSGSRATTFEESFRRRIRSMSEAARTTLTVAATAGSSIERRVLERVSDLTERELVDGLIEAEEAGVLRLRDGDRLEFTHALLRDAADEELSSSDVARAELHRCLAMAIEQVHAGELDAYAGQIAQHFDAAGGERERALVHYRRAAQRATAALAHGEAARLLERATTLATGADAETRAEIQLELGFALKRAGIGSYRAPFDRAYDLSRELDDSRRRYELARDALLGVSRGIFSYVGHIDEEKVERIHHTIAAAQPDDVADLALLKVHLAVELSFSPDRTLQRELAEEALALAHRSGDGEIIERVMFQFMVARWGPDSIDERLEIGHQLHERITPALRDPEHREAGRSPGLMVNAVTNYFQACMEGGRFDVAKRLLADLTTLADETRQPSTIGYACLRQSSWAAMRGELDLAARLAREALAAATEAQQPDAPAFFAGQDYVIHLHRHALASKIDELRWVIEEFGEVHAFRAGLALALVENGRADESRVHYERLLEIVPTLRKDLNYVLTVSITAACSSRLGDTGGAGLLFGHLEPYRARYVDIGTGFYGAVEHYLGLLESTLGRHDAGHESIRRAWTQYDHIGAAPWSIRGRVDGARTLVRIGRDDDARRLLDEAKAIADRASLSGLGRWVAEEIDELWSHRPGP